MVELIYIAQQINNNNAICRKLVIPATTEKPVTTTGTFTTLISVINDKPNLIMVEREVNAAKFAAINNVGDFTAIANTAKFVKQNFKSSFSQKSQVR